MESIIIISDVIRALKAVPDQTVQCCVTSPPYWGLRNYGGEEQIGIEKTPDDYIAKMVRVFREVWRVLKDDGVLWINIGDSYSTPKKGNTNGTSRGVSTGKVQQKKAILKQEFTKELPLGMRPKNLIGIPWRLAFALQNDGWNLRTDIIWNKPNAMPDSVTDRPVRSHEYIFLFTKYLKYYYDHEAVKEEAVGKASGNKRRKGNHQPNQRSGFGTSIPWEGKPLRNLRTVWSINTKAYAGAHFAVFPPELPEICIKAGSRAGDTVLDPFCGSGTTGAAAFVQGRSFIGIELNPEYAQLARKRITEAGATTEIIQ